MLQVEAAGCSKILVPGSSQKTNRNILFTAVRTYKAPVLKLSFRVSGTFDTAVFHQAAKLCAWSCFTLIEAEIMYYFF